MQTIRQEVSFPEHPVTLFMLNFSFIHWKKKRIQQIIKYAKNNSVIFVNKKKNHKTKKPQEIIVLK